MNRPATSFAPPLTDTDFREIQRFLYDEAGIRLTDAKRAMVAGRLGRRLRERAVSNFTEYLALLRKGDATERQHAIDLLTTNETFFFREPRHFDMLRQWLAGFTSRGPVRIWSAACSSGEEAWTLAMVLDDVRGANGWEVLASDLSTRVLEAARVGVYPEERCRHIPPDLLRRYCMKGVGAQDGKVMIGPTLRRNVSFLHHNLNNPPPQGDFDIVFLRNVMIYFDLPTKQRVVSNIAQSLRRGGLLCTGHSESLNGVTNAFETVATAIYRKP